MVNGPAYFPKRWKNNRDKISQHQNKAHCPVWGTATDNSCWVFNYNGVHNYWSSRAGGAFSFTDTLNDKFGVYDCTEREKIVLSRWIFDQNQKGIIPKISSSDIGDILKIEDISSEEKLTKILQLHDILAERPSIGIWQSGVLIQNAYDIRHLLMAGANIATLIDYRWWFDAANEEGFLSQHKYNGCTYSRLTPKGLTEIKENVKSISSQQAFVAMWFDEEMDATYDNAILPAVKAAGYSTYRVDKDNSHSDQITNKILAEIKNSKFLIADFTHGADGARGGVYFEAGYALGLGIPVLWLIRKDDVSKMHFDTNHYPHIVWETEEQLREQLEAAIIAHQHIGKGSS